MILPVPESAVSQVRVGQQVEVRVPSLDRSFPGKVARFAEKVQLSTRTMETEVDVPNPSLLLIPGMYAEVNLTLERRDKALAIPLSAVDTDRVMLVTPDNKLEVRKITLGLETANLVQVKSGLAEGDMVVIGNRGGLQAGQQVKPKVTALALAQENH